MNLMSDSDRTFECSNQPLVKRYGFGVAGVCLGFWFFDYVMRGWLGGTPSLAVSLRHTFIIAICLVFIVGFLLRQSSQKAALTTDGLAVFNSDGSQVRIEWSEIACVELLSKQVVISVAKGRRVPIHKEIVRAVGFVEALERLAGPDNELTIAVKKLLSR